MGCGESLVKYILFFANLFFALAGLALLGIGIAVQLQISVITNLIEGFQMAPISAMIVGGVVFLIAFFGCCGAIRESNCMLVVYAIVMIILMLLNIALAILIFVNLSSWSDSIPRWLSETFQTNQSAFHDIEREFQCCGTTGPNSYGIISLPPSCCAAVPCTLLNSYSGCNDVVSNFVHAFGLIIGLVAIAVAAIELVVIVFALCLANHARNKDRRMAY